MGGACEHSHADTKKMVHDTAHIVAALNGLDDAQFCIQGEWGNDAQFNFVKSRGEKYYFHSVAMGHGSCASAGFPIAAPKDEHPDADAQEADKLGISLFT